MSAQPVARDHPTARSAPPPLRVAPIPVTEPPARHGEPQPRRCPGPDAHGRTPEHYVQGTLAVDFRPEHEDVVFGPQATGTQDLPDPGDWARRLLRLVIECMDGQRPVSQLTRWVAPSILERVARRGTVSRRRGRVHRHAAAGKVLRVCEPADGVAEVAAILVHDGRVRAAALRLSGVDGRWLLTALELG